eukprot:NODE_967_length_2846_cov_0.660357.p2 type:complete len:297 gc:universal NODE_967_length_2846_cov_0.660357:868-1758(+)
MIFNNLLIAAPLPAKDPLLNGVTDQTLDGLIKQNGLQTFNHFDVAKGLLPDLDAQLEFAKSMANMEMLFHPGAEMDGKVHHSVGKIRDARLDDLEKEIKELEELKRDLGFHFPSQKTAQKVSKAYIELRNKLRPEFERVHHELMALEQKTTDTRKLIFIEEITKKFLDQGKKVLDWYDYKTKSLTQKEKDEIDSKLLRDVKFLEEMNEIVEKGILSGTPSQEVHDQIQKFKDGLKQQNERSLIERNGDFVAYTDSKLVTRKINELPDHASKAIVGAAAIGHPTDGLVLRHALAIKK